MMLQFLNSTSEIYALSRSCYMTDELTLTIQEKASFKENGSLLISYLTSSCNLIEIKLFWK